MEAVAAPARQVRHEARPGRRTCVIGDLAALHGPRHGTPTLPRRLYWSGKQPRYSLDDPYGRKRIYQIVLREAAHQDELGKFLNLDYLLALWPDLFLPPGVRAAWEAQYRILAARSRHPARTAA